MNGTKIMRNGRKVPATCEREASRAFATREGRANDLMAQLSHRS